MLASYTGCLFTNWVKPSFLSRLLFSNSEVCPLIQVTWESFFFLLCFFPFVASLFQFPPCQQRGTRNNHDRPPFSTSLKSYRLTMVNTFLLGLSLANHPLQSMCALSYCTCNHLQLPTALQVIYVLSIFPRAHVSFFNNISPSFSQQYLRGLSPT